ncbi:copper amine oxidase N-terminal domain-containing protein [Paenibacillus alginolyticus]|uniref:Copper amine oxidase N-terminal domain-containing protein n=1 Tax=Paenibacillus alginolyticus TaxID=59839 RepID=A0ABT4GJR7_9BACL|nr:copper amine oxidase N-terminal domain-containing protein [Paenibacillus alginolyticus]MCY9696430.1 copper amine oxidase N-terminal domain-containing protein [Paenibacillus alginolyticus]MEC0145255.1 copper amine oxidase N-terminal domain-containing protein [Paenibacillus alginolyticus]
MKYFKIIFSIFSVIIINTLILTSCFAEDNGSWETIGEYTDQYNPPISSVLPNGNVLIVNGNPYESDKSAKYYDPENKTFTATNERTGSGASDLIVLNNDLVMLVGGHRTDTSEPFGARTQDSIFSPLRDIQAKIDYRASSPEVEFYNVKTNSWSIGKNLPSAMSWPKGITLKDGRVLVFGGEKVTTEGSYYPSGVRVQIYEPNSDSWKVGAGFIFNSLGDHISSCRNIIVLPNNKVFVQFGASNSTSTLKIYDPVSDIWEDVAEPYPENQIIKHDYYFTSELADGKILLLRGMYLNKEAYLKAKEVKIYNYKDNTWTNAAELPEQLQNPSLTYLSSINKVLVFGYHFDPESYKSSDYYYVTEFYDPLKDVWITGIQNPQAQDPKILLLKNENVMSYGELGSNRNLKLIEIYTPPLPAIKVFINNIAQSYEVDPYIMNGNTMVPLRGIFEQLGATVSWDENTKTAKSIKSNTAVEIRIGSNQAKVNGKELSLEQAAVIMNGSTMVPLRFIAESLGAKVEYDSVQRSVFINIKNEK